MLPSATLERPHTVAREDHAVPPRRAEKWPSLHESLMQRFRGEYLEMPGLRLTLEQAQRLFSVERNVCTAVLGALVKERFLGLRPNGTYVRLTEGTWPQPRPATLEGR